MFVLRPRSSDDHDGPTIADLVGRVRRHLRHEVLRLPRRHGARQLHGRLRVHLAGSRDEPAERAAGTQVPRQRPRVQAGDGRHALGAQQVHDLAGPAQHAGGGVAHHEAAQPRPLGLVVIRGAPMVTDERERHDHDLAGVARVGADLLVARLGGVDDEIAAASHRGPEGDAGGRPSHPRAPAGRDRCCRCAGRPRHQPAAAGPAEPFEAGRVIGQPASPAARTRSIRGPMTSTQPAYCLAVG